MIEVTDEMLKVARSMQSFELMIKRIIELHEDNKPKPEQLDHYDAGMITDEQVIEQNVRDLISEAVAFAALSHKGQVDKGGVPYILHCLYVMNSVVKKHGHHDQELAAIAVLHDVVEDTGATFDTVGFMFGDRVAAGVDALTKRNGESSDDYLSRVKANPDAVYVKISDLQHNRDLNRLPSSIINDERCMARHARYGEMLSELHKQSKPKPAQLPNNA